MYIYSSPLTGWAPNYLRLKPNYGFLGLLYQYPSATLALMQTHDSIYHFSFLNGLTQFDDKLLDDESKKDNIISMFLMIPIRY